MPMATPPRSDTARSCGNKRNRRLLSTVVRCATFVAPSGHGRGAGSESSPRSARQVDEIRDLEIDVVAADHVGVQRPGPTDAHGAPAQRACGPPKSLRGLSATYTFSLPRVPTRRLHELERLRVRLAVTGAEVTGEQDRVGPALESERFDLGPLAVHRAVGHDREGHRTREAGQELGGVGQELDAGCVAAVALDHRGDGLGIELDLALAQHRVEDVAAPPADEVLPRGVGHALLAQRQLDPLAHRVEPTAHVVALEVQRVVDVQHETARRGRGHRPASVRSTKTASS